ncbi:MAG: hypothetical protein JGK17_28235 [Microcoleus sp. PH2017_10_PVI_O_A]|nr:MULTISPECIES: hypothetical protein [unclassified Microcoleus]MCC3409376.1 hypothetical protein [Microcoleus sp. PH2017_10_PVI_O_A]MCC3463619.1 hypothetical protein [Microcoleus sp. PH2017_11_PCY_U_A]MCC3481973.1 hypothetical protein [Microcoleus sp. PH2017_12_PCY_D_A]MCC3530742.1 hypothetical protein [Microcoleus sp. PH2017_21_RUC_O_A]MCC3543112.1 hypothetical protein [Microcoleus sp. PH2017_22_RUC_O_B]
MTSDSKPTKSTKGSVKDKEFVTFTPPGTYAGKLTDEEILQVADYLNSF